jgi:hypothetical protein
MRSVLSTLFCFVLLSVSAEGARGDIIFNNGPPDLLNVHHSDFDQSAPSNTGILGDDFTLSAANVVRDVHWFGAYAFNNIPPALDNFTIRFFNFTGPTPDINPFLVLPLGHVSRSDTGLNIGAFDVFQYDVAVPDLPLAPGKYLLSIVNNTAGTQSDWYWANSNDVGNAFERGVDTNRWIPIDGRGGELSFALTNDVVSVPEPSSWMLLALGTLSLARYGWQKRKRAILEGRCEPPPR